MRKSRIGLNLIDGTDQFGDLPEVFDENMEKIQSLIEGMLFDIKELKEDVRMLKYSAQD